MLLIIDNYDSFTWNLFQYFSELGVQTEVIRNDEIDIEGIRQLNPHWLVISPGPCTPDQAGISLEIIRQFAGVIPILGVCLGHQAIAQEFGGKVVRAKQPVHGKTSLIQHSNQGVFDGLSQPLRVTRYHSLVVEQSSLPDEFEVTAWLDIDDEVEPMIMGIRHQELPIEGVQFHPESVLTEQGHQLLQNFISAYPKQL